MKRIIKNIAFAAVAVMTMASCADWLDVQDYNKIDNLTSDEQIEAYMASYYHFLPVEDFMYYFSTGDFRYTGNLGGEMNASVTFDQIHSEWGNYDGDDTNSHKYWEQGYEYIYKINKLKDAIPTMKPSREEMYDQLHSEAAFFEAYAYFQLAKRYGGVSLIKESQNFEGGLSDVDPESLKVPRSTERATWNYVLELCDKAAEYLPEEKNGYRATKWAALALKSRAALFAASVAKFWNEAPLGGAAATNKLVGGMSVEDMEFYYQECIDASAEIIRSEKFSLYKPDPASFEEATANYRKIFADPKSAATEVIFSKGYAYPGIAHSMGAWHEPNQLSKQYGGRANPTLDFVDAYEYIDEDGVGSLDSKLKTRTDTESYNGLTEAALPNFIRYDHPLDIFKDKDPRLAATVILPYSTWKGTEIVIQGGLVKPAGKENRIIFLTSGSYETDDNKKYYAYGAEQESQYSGWVSALSNGTITGFLLKKFLPDGEDQTQNQVTTDYIDFRYAEILLNYAEALIESGLTAPADIIDGKAALNASRRRAGFTNSIDLSVENVQRERRIEMGLEYTRNWDNVRRRQSHVQFNGSSQRSALVPVLDLSGADPKYIFVRSRLNEPGGAKVFRDKHYYRIIPGIDNNGVIQNPGY